MYVLYHFYFIYLHSTFGIKILLYCIVLYDSLTVVSVIVGQPTRSLDHREFIHVMVTYMAPGHKAT